LKTVEFLGPQKRGDCGKEGKITVHGYRLRIFGVVVKVLRSRVSTHLTGAPTILTDSGAPLVISVSSL
jgi:hypothetical protein